MYRLIENISSGRTKGKRCFARAKTLLSGIRAVARRCQLDDRSGYWIESEDGKRILNLSDGRTFVSRKGDRFRVSHNHPAYCADRGGYRPSSEI